MASENVTDVKTYVITTIGNVKVGKSYVIMTTEKVTDDT